jgi:hypothetical protein
MSIEPSASLTLGAVESSRFGDDHAGRPGQGSALEFAPAGLGQPFIRVVFTIGLTLTRNDQELTRGKRRCRWLGVGRIHPQIDEEQGAILWRARPAGDI